jgi:hypothetical protein
VTIFLIPALFLAACEGFRSAHGIVKDKVTGKPLDSVACFAPTARITIITDSSGKFDVQNAMGGCIPDCKDIIVQFSKRGYKTLEVTNPTDSVFFLERQ